MRRLLYMLLALCVLGSASAQTNKCGVDTKALVHEGLAAGVATFDFLAKMAPGFDRDALEKQHITIGAQAGSIVTLHVPAGSLRELDDNREVLQYSIAHPVAGPMMNNVRSDTRTDRVQSGRGVDSHRSYNGKGVYIGITDWGFDYTHINYNNRNAANWRLDRAWDHFRLGGTPPAGFSYGAEIAGHEALIEARGDTSNIYGYGTHGTHVAGIAAGFGMTATAFRGQAPGAHLLFCTFGLNDVNWMEGVAWMHRVAQDSTRRLVVNSSWGMYTFSTLDGTSLLSQAIDSMSAEGVVFVTSAGNNGDNNFHLSRNFAEDPDTLKTIATYYNYAEDANGQCLIMWGERGHDFSVGIRMKGDDGLWASPMFSTSVNDLDTNVVYDTLHCGSIAIPYRVLIEHINPFDSLPHIQIDVDKDLSLQLQLFIAAADGTVHAWNVAKKTNHAGNEGADFSSGTYEDRQAGFVGGDPYYGIGEPACASKTISVAAHNADTWSSDSSHYYTGALAYFSSYGPLINQRQKPEISAPGLNVRSSISRWCDSYRATDSTRYEGEYYKWSSMSGTSMSSPAVTGIIALLLQADPTLSVDQIRDIITTTARNDDLTGPLLARDSADLRWGWGKIDALQAINEVIRRVDIRKVEELRLPLQVYPNPAHGSVTVHTGCGEPQALQVFTASGHRVLDVQVLTEATLDTRGWPPGLYIVRVGSRVEKLIIQ